MECNLVIPGNCWLDEENSEIKDNVVVDAKYLINKEVQEIAQAATQIMVDTETEFFEEVGSPIKGKADWSVAPYWKH
jgi:hypothetical protein